MTFDFFKLYNEYKDRKESIHKLRSEIATQLNTILKKLKLNDGYRSNYITSSDDYDLRITKRILDKDTHHFLANIEIFDIWETHNEHEYAHNWLIPTYVLTDKNYVERYEHQQSSWIEQCKQREINFKAQQKATKEKQDMNTYRRIARKLKKKT